MKVVWLLSPRWGKSMQAKKVRNNMKIAHFLITLLIFTATVSASEIYVKGNLYNPTPGYFSTWQSEFEIFYTNYDTKFGDKIYLKYGFSGGFSSHSGNNHWAKEQKIEMRAIADYRWLARFEDEVASRGSYGYDYLDFVIIVTDARDNVKFVDNGTGGAKHSFYRLNLNTGHGATLHEYYVVIQ